MNMATQLDGERIGKQVADEVSARAALVLLQARGR